MKVGAAQNYCPAKSVWDSGATKRKENEMNPNTPSTEQILFIIRRIIAELAIEPEKTKVKVEEIGFQGSTVGIEIDAWPADYSKILGQKTDNLRAMMMICKLVTDRCGGRKSFELTLKRIPKDDSVVPRNLDEFKPIENWRRDDIRALTEDIFTWIVGQPFKVLVSDGKQGKTAIDVIIGNQVSSVTADWIKIKLQPLYKAMGMRNGRIIIFNLIQDETVLAKFAAPQFTPDDLKRLSKMSPK